MSILVTGSAGFIGNHLALRLLQRGDEVIGLDCVNDYYDVRLKEARLQRLKEFPRFTEARIALEEQKAISALFARHRPERVAHLAAQAGVRYSLEHPHVYINSNITGFLNILEACRQSPVEHLVYASSSSVYGINTRMPFSVEDGVDHPISLYGATKKANELMAHSYSHLFDIPTTGLRFFTVYGPWGRPDMALFLFTRAILAGEPIDVFNEGKMERDFTYIDDIVEGVLRLLDGKAAPREARANGILTPGSSPTAPYRIFNIGHNSPVPLIRFIQVLEEKLGRKATMNLMPMQPGDVRATYADVSDLMETVDYKPDTPIEVGIDRFVTWYREFYGS